MWLLGLWGCGPSPEAPVVLEPADARSFVVLELFTSQSCSSCPLADAQVNDLAGDYPVADVRVFPLAWHVTTWDGLGWVDRYSDPRYTDRQHAYARILPSRSYTPMMVAQGQEDFNGQIRERIDAAMVHWIGMPGATDIALQLVLGDGTLAVAADVQPAPQGAELQVVVVESGLVDHIPSGENSGRTLHHDNVVRSWITGPLDAAALTLPIPDDVDLDRAAVVALVQDRDTMAIIGAQAAEIPR
jgi:hypothetical protein